MIRLNRYLYIAILLCFFLPFCEGCNFLSIPAEEKAAMEKVKRDSIKVFGNINADSLKYTETEISQSDTSSIISPPKEESFLKNAISNLLLPNGDYSGFFLVIIGVKSLQGWLSLVPGYIILIMLVFMTNKAEINYKRVFIYSSVFLFFMIVFLAFNFNELMYGFWTCLALAFINMLIAGFIHQRSQSGPHIQNN